MSIRQAAVAGTFYPGGEDDLRRLIAGALPPAPKARAWAVVVPHAGYLYSGKVAGAVYARVRIPRTVVVLCFNHRGRGARFGLWPGGAWRTPLGDAPVDGGRTGMPDFLENDEAGHLGEHSGEVQVPFLQYLNPEVEIVPIALSVELDDRGFDQLREFGRALAGRPGEFLVVASSDLNHYESQAETVRKDEAVIREIERLDEEGLRRAIEREGVSMCGYAPVIAAIAYARARGARSAKTVMHATSGDVSGDFDRVVGYAGMIVECGN